MLDFIRRLFARKESSFYDIDRGEFGKKGWQKELGGPKEIYTHLSFKELNQGRTDIGDLPSAPVSVGEGSGEHLQQYANEFMPSAVVGLVMMTPQTGPNIP